VDKLFEVVHDPVPPILQITVSLHQLDIGLHHVFEEAVEVAFRFPTQLCFGFGGVADEEFDFCGAEVAGIYSD
jgi:hypothetical protein